MRWGEIHLERLANKQLVCFEGLYGWGEDSNRPTLFFFCPPISNHHIYWWVCWKLWPHYRIVSVFINWLFLYFSMEIAQFTQCLMIFPKANATQCFNKKIQFKIWSVVGLILEPVNALDMLVMKSLRWIWWWTIFPYFSLSFFPFLCFNEPLCVWCNFYVSVFFIHLTWWITVQLQWSAALTDGGTGRSFCYYSTAYLAGLNALFLSIFFLSFFVPSLLKLTIRTLELKVPYSFSSSHHH